MSRTKTYLRLSLEVLEKRTLPSSSIVEAPSAGIDSYVVTCPDAWSASSNDSWLHTSSSGSGKGLATFTFDANTGATRTGTLTIAGDVLTVTQAGGAYATANPMGTLVGSGLSNPKGAALDAAGNVYIADYGHNAVKVWNASTQQVTTLIASGLSFPSDVTVDAAGNVYIADSGHNAIKEWDAQTQQVTTLVASGLSVPSGLAVDGDGNVYIADFGNNAVKEWVASTQQVTTLVSSGLSSPSDVAVDGSGNVYICDTNNYTVKEWNAVTHAVTSLVTGLSVPEGVAVDGSGNVYVADSGNNAIKEWQAATQQITTLASGQNFPIGLAVDGARDVFLASFFGNAVKELPRAFVPTTPISESGAAGSDALLPVLPTTEALTGVFAPTSDQSWLTIGSVANGVVPFSFSANTDRAARTAHITVLGQQITVTQNAASSSASIVSVVVNGDYAPISRASQTDTTVTITTNGNHGFTAGNTVVISGFQGANSGYNGAFTIASIPAANQFTVTNSTPSLPTLTGNPQGFAISDNTASALIGNQRSMVDSVAYTFNMPVNLAANAITMGLGSATTTGPASLAALWSPILGPS